jgi:heptosyltransferase-1
VSQPTPLLLTRLSALGDIVHTWPLAQALSSSFRVFWLVEERFLPLVAPHPAVTQAIPVATRRWRKAPFSLTTWRQGRAAWERIRALCPEVAVDPQGLLKSAAWAWLAGVPRRLGFAATHRREGLAGAFYTETVSPSSQWVHVVDLNLALAAHLCGQAPFGSAPDASFLLPHLPPAPPEAKAVLLLPGSGQKKKNWPVQAFAALARLLQGEGLPVTVLWGPGEKRVAEAICQGAPGTNLAPPTQLLQLASFLAAGRAVVGGDTGPLHLAAALGTPTVALHLTTDPQRNSPRGPKVTVLAGAKSGATGGRARTGKEREISPEEVLAAVGALLSKTR